MILEPKKTNVAYRCAECGGTWIVPKDALAAGDWDRIERLAAEAAASADKIRA